jgi:hypothetical protein
MGEAEPHCLQRDLEAPHLRGLAAKEERTIMPTFDDLQYNYRPSSSSAVRTMAIVVGSVLYTLVSGPIPWAAADPASGVYVRTESGIVRCVIRPDEVTREAGENPTQPHTGFLQAPMDQTFHWDLAVVTTTGDFHWANGNIGTPLSTGETVLTYGTNYYFKGWTVEGTSDGTRFTNDNTGHGMFVSIENVYSF